MPAKISRKFDAFMALMDEATDGQFSCHLDTGDMEHFRNWVDDTFLERNRRLVPDEDVRGWAKTLADDRASRKEES